MGIKEKGYRTLMIVSVVICPLTNAFTSVITCGNCIHKFQVQDHQVLCTFGEKLGVQEDEH